MKVEMRGKKHLRLVVLITLLGAVIEDASTAFAQDMPGKGLVTRWAKDVSATNPLPEYPRPGMTRARWLNLNGPWDFAVTDESAGTIPADFVGKILVPYPYESALSGIRQNLAPGKTLWYRRKFTVPADWSGNSVLLNFGAVNWHSTIYLNGQKIAEHKGGYDGFSVDLGDGLKAGDNDLVVAVVNSLTIDSPDAQIVGKQRRHPRSIFYTPCTGIWQTVWLEPVPKAHIANLKIVPDIDAKTVHVTVEAAGATTDAITLTATIGGMTTGTATGQPGADMTLPIPDPHLWSPEDPFLYNLHIALGKTDSVDSYFAMRKISLGKDDKGITRILLNNKFVFQVGALDQGYWPDGIYTASTDQALKSDILAAKDFGFNLLRKHAKVEPQRWYYWTDKLGILVWQDMPQCFGKVQGHEDTVLSDDAKAQWLIEWKQEIAQFMNHPSIVVWTTFNEGWGQHDTAAIVALTKQLDPSRLVNDASGWNDKKVGDIHDTHAYPGPRCDKPEENRATVNGEFGGITMRVPGHMWTTDVMGYGAVLGDGWKVTQKYQALLKAAYSLRDERGCSAVVYTQLTDVEQESNGLLTYDRAIIKPLAEIVAAANRGRFPELPRPPASQGSAIPGQ